ncbi:hypothetical protein AB0N73_10330 [Microbacterium sp. NPDC089189]|uniref:hypothetical protein n=1 Tax=Microbacterium sp. NPDC089189 TaxID=3154972 RepID=UPI003433483D
MTRAPLPVTAEAVGTACEHAWATRSTHRTSEGFVSYVACVRCAALRVDIRRTATAVPEAASHPTPRAPRDAPAPSEHAFRE